MHCLTVTCYLRPAESELFGFLPFFCVLESGLGLNLLESTPVKTNQCLMCFPLVNDLSHCRTMDLNMFINYILSLPRLSSSNNCLFKINARVFPGAFTPECSSKLPHFCFYRCLFIIYYLSAFDNLHLAASYSFNFCASSLFFLTQCFFINDDSVLYVYMLLIIWGCIYTWPAQEQMIFTISWFENLSSERGHFLFKVTIRTALLRLKTD